MPRGHKYNAKKKVCDNIKFDSGAEVDRYLHLKSLLHAGKIKNLKLHPKYLLLDRFIKNNLRFRAVKYEADFEYFDIDKNKIIIEDVKGVQTEVFRIKRKMFEMKYPDLQLTIIPAYPKRINKKAEIIPRSKDLL